MRVVQLTPHSLLFPPPEGALREPNGLLAVGGDLSPARLKLAYQSGIFPWYNPGEMILWWSPDPRAVLFPDALHISRSMRRFLRHCPFQFTLNHAFPEVIAACAEARSDGTWIGPAVAEAYRQLHREGIAHSIEVWQEGELVGGMYGVAQGALFCGESMFSRRTNASKAALVMFCHHFVQQGGQLLDCQVLNDHTASLGATEIPRHHFLSALRQLQRQALPAGCWQPQTLQLPASV
ncbi:leucyl/phenylalanyl-tRNA--protein transferase [Nissabacter sp. SGAir0207]|uniref:leucyl/phenylalanyl-tRNA--protein transferase n=1 Tax=Nissabacter sp. SGAir0207 TaxID=2126321 RepID=UPI0010CD344F|nr:leucyl/phenylalanyl-tRNA--protein transferase [Nissabacter sp. SGAir0207]QCR36574.1 leucyl/phenylalanyl-tRNA--protein transferase [Nissabacter sp. SGAir0207]